MTEPNGHCPYLGLKQNRAIRFASPTPEHRCFVSGEPLEIPVDQSSYCLAQGHVHCPLYMGLSVPTTGDALTPIGGIAMASGALIAPTSGMRGWLGTLSPRDRAIYAIMISMLAIIVAIYLFVGLQTLFRPNESVIGALPTSAIGTNITAATQSTAEAATVYTNATNAAGIAQTATSEPSTPTDLPTNVPSPTPTVEPTRAPVILPPTSRPTLPPTAVPATVAVAATGIPPTATPTTASVAATAIPPTARTATSAPKPTAAPAQPTAIPAPPTAIPAPPVSASSKPLTLYFADATASVLVPVRRNAGVEDNRIAEAAVRELIAGPRNGLQRLVSADTVLLGIQVNNGLAIVNFDRDPSAGNDRGLDSIVLTLTDLGTVTRVQIQINGANIGSARGRPVVNPANPLNLAFDYSATEFLPLYFPSVDGIHDVRIISMVPKTKQVGEATVQALLDGPPPEYGGAVWRIIPADTQLRGITLNNGVLLVDFTQPFAESPDVNGAMRTVIESLTSIKSVRGVQFLVEGQAFADGKVFGKPAINQE
ncbi:MAG: GerMN domain-containing protein [Roseiflexaceae bacterium]